MHILDSVLFFPLSLRFVIVCVTIVQFIEHFLDTHLKGGVQKLDVLFNTMVHDTVYALC